MSKDFFENPIEGWIKAIRAEQQRIKEEIQVFEKKHLALEGVLVDLEDSRMKEMGESLVAIFNRIERIDSTILK
jgi:hypothetical protein